MNAVDRQLRLLAVFGDALADAMTLEEVGAALLAHASMFDAASGSLYVREDDALALGPAWGFTDEEQEAWRLLPLDAATPVAACVRRGRTVTLGVSDSLERYADVADDEVEGEWVVEPLRVRDEAIGALCLRIDGQPLDEERLVFLRRVANLLASAVQRAQLVRDLRNAAEVEERLLATLSHDLRTPLGAVTMGAQFLERRLPQGVEAEAARRVHRSARRATELIDSVLAFSRNRRAIARTRLPSLPVAPMVREQLDELRSALPDAEVVGELPSTAPVHVEPVAVGQIVANLVRNAVQHGTPGRPVQVRLTDRDEDVELQVCNEGEPLSREQLAELFEPFRRGTKRTGGVGLGLFIVKQLAERMGATVDARCDEHIVFIVRWPRA